MFYKEKKQKREKEEEKEEKGEKGSRSKGEEEGKREEEEEKRREGKEEREMEEGGGFLCGSKVAVIKVSINVYIPRAEKKQSFLWSLERGKYLYRKPQEIFHYISFFSQGVLMPLHEDIYITSFCCQGSIQLPLKYPGTMEKSIGTKI